MNSNCALRNLYSDSLLKKVEINLGGGVRFLAISLSVNKSKDNCIVDFVRRLLLAIRECLLICLCGCFIIQQSSLIFFIRACIFTNTMLQQINTRTEKGMVDMCLDNDLRLKALDLFERGFSYKAVARQLQLNPETVREWVYLWRALGSDLYKHPEKRPHRYSPEVKLAAIKDRLNGVPMIDIMRRYQIASRNRIKSWCAQYAKKGPSAFGKNKQQ